MLFQLKNKPTRKRRNIKTNALFLCNSILAVKSTFSTPENTKRRESDVFERILVRIKSNGDKSTGRFTNRPALIASLTFSPVVRFTRDTSKNQKVEPLKEDAKKIETNSAK